MRTGRFSFSWHPPWTSSITLSSNFVKAVLALSLLAGGAEAQSRPCEERLAEFRVYADLVAAGRTKSEVEAAQGIAALRRENDQLRAEIGRLAEQLKSARGQK